MGSTTARLSVLAAASTAVAQPVNVTSLTNTSEDRTDYVTGQTLTHESVIDDLGVTQTGAGRYTASARVRFGHAFSVEPGGPTVALLSRRKVGGLMVFEVLDPDNRGYEIEVETLLKGEAAVLGPDSGTGSFLAITANAGFFGFFDDDVTDADPAVLLASTGVATGTVGVDTTDFETIERFDEQNDQNLGAFSGTNTYSIEVNTGTSPAGSIIQNNLTGDAGLLFGLVPTFPFNGTFPGLVATPDALNVLSVMPDDGLTFHVNVVFFCNAADVAPPATVLDLDDVDAFIAAFQAGDVVADIAEPFGIVDLSDIDAFIAAFLGGCP
ncbi:MAG: GC-type dockerin domain-anchored protein [Planctomycetota bacterium]